MTEEWNVIKRAVESKLWFTPDRPNLAEIGDLVRQPDHLVSLLSIMTPNKQMQRTMNLIVTYLIFALASGSEKLQLGPETLLDILLTPDDAEEISPNELEISDRGGILIRRSCMNSRETRIGGSIHQHLRKILSSIMVRYPNYRKLPE